MEKERPPPPKPPSPKPSESTQEQLPAQNAGTNLVKKEEPPVDEGRIVKIAPSALADFPPYVPVTKVGLELNLS